VETALFAYLDTSAREILNENFFKIVSGTGVTDPYPNHPSRGGPRPAQTGDEPAARVDADLAEKGGDLVFSVAGDLPKVPAICRSSAVRICSGGLCSRPTAAARNARP